MTHMRTKLLVGSVILAAAVAYLAIAGVKKGWVYYLPVHEYLAGPDYRGTRVRLAGDVLEDQLDAQPGMLLARFQMSDDQTDRTLSVAYRGPIPDMFKAGAQVVIEGREEADGVFHADVLMTKCASKYEEQPKEHPAADGADASGPIRTPLSSTPLPQKETDR